MSAMGREQSIAEQVAIIVYRGLMVDMRTRNAKLLLRATAMVGHLAHCDEETAKEALVAADGDLKLAVLLAHGTDAETAITLIRRNRGHLRSAIPHHKA
jgi:N-acetylmuramic acid 6-phosphate etherase